VGEPCERWTGIIPGQGRFTSHAHPECYRQTEIDKWDPGDWESCGEGDMQRPNGKLCEHGRDGAPGKEQP
jgi:hypothetical protein